MKTARVVHHVPGRIRLRIVDKSTDPDLLEKIQRSLGEIDDVNRVRLNHATGSVVVEYEPEHFAEMLERAAQATALHDLILDATPKGSEFDAAIQFAQTELEGLARHSLTAKHLLEAVNRIN